MNKFAELLISKFRILKPPGCFFNWFKWVCIIKETQCTDIPTTIIKIILILI